MSKWTTQFSFGAGTQVTPETSVFLLGKDDLVERKMPHSVIAVLDDGRWSATSTKWPAISVCWGKRPTEELIVVGYEGDMQAGQLGALKEETPIEIDNNDGKSGYLKCARTIAGRVYIGGMDRQVYRRVTGGWEAFDKGLPPGAEGEALSVEAIDGFSADEIYAVGRKGEIWRCDGKRWRAIASPTNLILLGLHCADDGFVYACGQVGTLLRGRGDTWEVISHKATKQDIWDVASFKGVVYLATRKVLYALKNGQIAPVDFGPVSIPFSFHRFALSDDKLISIGAKDVMSFDGKNWSRVD
jgi:hypothetical protein